MPKFRKRPVEIEAWQWNGETRPKWPRYLLDTPLSEIKDGRHGVVELRIPTLEGEMTAKRGDWIIRGIKGEVYPCKPDIFAATYEPVAT